MGIQKNAFQKIKALAIDLDGTALLPDTSLGRKTLRVLTQLMAQGMQVIFCTGRAIESSERYRTAIGTEGPMVYFNGAEVVDMPSGTVLSANLLEPDVIDFCVDISRSMDVHFQVFLPPGIIEGKDKWEALVIEKQRAESEMYHKHTGIIPIAHDLKTIVSLPGLRGCVKAMFICDSPLHDEIRKKLSQRFGGRIYVARTFPTFLEVMNAGVSKGEGLKTVMQHRGLNADEVLALGDEENDLTMFKVSGLSAAPASARENVRAAADFIFASNAEEGLAAFLEEKFL